MMKPEYTNVSNVMFTTEECVIAFYLNTPIINEELVVTGDRNIEVACVAMSMGHLRKLYNSLGEALKALDKATDTSRA